MRALRFGIPRRGLSRSRSLACAVGLAATASMGPAAAYYEESHVVGDDANVTVDVDGQARVEHVVTWHVVAGQMHSLDLGIDAAAQVEPDATATAEDGHVYAATVAPHEAGIARVLFEEPKGLKHGHYKVRLAYRVDLAASHAFSRDGAMWRLSLPGLSLTDGYDGARATFILPSAVDAPRPLDGSDGGDPGVIATLRRAPDKDELDLVKPHVARRETVLWTLRVAPRAFPAVHDPSLRPPKATRLAPVPEPRAPAILLAAAALALALVYRWLVAWKLRAFDALCRSHGARARGLLSGAFDRAVSTSWRAALAGAAFGAGVWLELVRLSTAGGACVAIAALLAASRGSRSPARPQGPGKWLALRADEAFPRPARADFFDPTSLRGALATLASVVLTGSIGVALARWSSRAPYLVGLDAVALLPLFATGLRSQLPPDAAAGARWLRRMFARLAQDPSLRVAPWARVPAGSVAPDEVRVLVVPRAPMPGLVGVEVGLSWRESATSFAPLPGLLVRVHACSAASARMATLRPSLRPVPGRTAEERVFRLRPTLPTFDASLRLARRLARALEDRRVESRSWRYPERRVPASERDADVAQAA